MRRRIGSVLLAALFALLSVADVWQLGQAVLGRHPDPPSLRGQQSSPSPPAPPRGTFNGDTRRSPNDSLRLTRSVDDIHSSRGRMNRRRFVSAAASCLGVPLFATRRRGQRRASTRLILLGTAGGPRPRATRSAPAQAIVVGDTAYIVDCGDGVARQLVLAGVPLRAVRHIFITHHHSDHNADYGNLILLAWAAGLRTRLDSWGPPPLGRLTNLFFEMSAADIEARTADEGRVPLKPLVHAHELRTGGPVMQDANVRVTAALVHHPPMVPAFAYRFDAADRSIVISGDTTPSERLVALARNADILVHEALYDAAAVDRLVASVPNASDLRRSILSHHTTAAEAGRVAAEAGVGMLVLSHLVPAEDPTITDEMWSSEARKHFNGRIVVAKDLMEL